MPDVEFVMPYPAFFLITEKGNFEHVIVDGPRPDDEETVVVDRTGGDDEPRARRVEPSSGVGPGLSVRELDELRERHRRGIGKTEVSQLFGDVHVADLLRLVVVACKRPDNRHGDQED